MSTRFTRWCVGLVAAVALAGMAARAGEAYPAFHGELAPYGNWFKIASQWVWQPQAATMDAAWRPYLHGGNWSWEGSGWFWVSDYVWGAKAFHYGRWWHSPANGWVWVPGTVWGPAWVTWRATADSCGWAPLPPDSAFLASVGSPTDGGGVEMALSDFSFVPHASFLARGLDVVAVDGTAHGDASVAVSGGPAPAAVGQYVPAVVYTQPATVVEVATPAVVTAPVYASPLAYYRAPVYAVPSPVAYYGYGPSLTFGASVAWGTSTCSSWPVYAPTYCGPRPVHYGHPGYGHGGWGGHHPGGGSGHSRPPAATVTPQPSRGGYPATSIYQRGPFVTPGSTHGRR